MEHPSMDPASDPPPERVSATDAELHAVDRFRSAFAFSPIGMCIHSPEGTIAEVNRAFCGLVGRSAETCRGANWLELIHPADREPAARMADRLIRGQIDSFEDDRRYVTPEGTIVWTHAFVTMIPRRGQFLPYVILVLQDRSMLTRLEDRLAQSARMESVGLLASGLAHDFNNLLAIVSGHLEILLATESLTASARSRVEASHAALGRGADLVGNLSDITRISSQNPHIVHLNAEITSLAGLVDALLDDGITLDLDLRADRDLIRMDPHQLEQVVLNLIVNACDAMPGGGRIVLTTYAVDPSEVPTTDTVFGPRVELAVSDTGIGMSPETLDVAFEPLFTTKAPGSGTGLGLASARYLIEQSFGTLTATSCQGHGSTFTVCLPLQADCGPDPQTAPHPIHAPGSSSARHELVLIVEDEPELLAIIDRMLRQSGYETLTAKDADRARRVISEHGGEIDLLVSDLVLPDMGGDELVDLTQRDWPGVSTILISGHTAPTARPGQVFLAKPFTGAELLSTVRWTLDA